MKKRLLLVILAISTFFSFSSAFASQNNGGMMQPMWTNISTVGGGVSISSSGVASLSARMVAYDPVNNTKITTSLQQYKNGSWTTLSSWSQTSYSRNCSWASSKSVTKGYTYRLVCNYYAYNGSTLLESTSKSYTDAY